MELMSIKKHGCLPSKHEALSSNPSTTKQTSKKTKHGCHQDPFGVPCYWQTSDIDWCWTSLISPWHWCHHHKRDLLANLCLGLKWPQKVRACAQCSTGTPEPTNCWFPALGPNGAVPYPGWKGQGWCEVALLINNHGRGLVRLISI
jgi:hypothetical protein